MYRERNNNNVKVIDKNIPSRANWKKERWKFDVNYWSLFIPSALALVCYVNGLHGDFVHDDVYAIKRNRDVLGSSPLSDLWLNDFWGKPMSSNRSHKSYRPFTVLSFRWNYMTTGPDSFYFHAVNVILHVIVTSLFAFTCKDVFNLSQTCSIIAGALFAVHPIHTEAVTGIVGRADELSAMFFLLSFLAYVKSLSSTPRDFPVVEHTGMFLLSFLLAAVGMLCKETGITVLGMCLLYDVGVVCRTGVVRYLNGWKTHGSEAAPLVRRALAVLAVTFCLLSLRLCMMGGTMPDFAYSDNPASFQSSPLTRYFSYGFIWAYNCWMLLMPYELCYDWQNGSIPLVKTFGDPRNLATLLLIIFFAAVIYKTFTKFKSEPVCPSSPDPVLVAVLFTVIPFIPASNIFFRVGFVLAERILYIPSMGFCILVAVGFCKFMERWPHKRTQIVAILCSFLLLHAWKTWRRNEDWRSREALFRSGINSLPQNSKVHYNYANLLKDITRREEAIHHYRESIRLSPEHAGSYNNLGTLLEDPEEKVWHYSRALEIMPNHAGAHINMGNIHLKTGNASESLRFLHRAVELDSHSHDALDALAWALMETGQPGRAEEYMQRAITAYPAHTQSRLQYGELLKRLDRHEEAVQHFKAAYELDNTASSALVSAAQSLNKLGDMVQAETLLKQAIGVQRNSLALEQLALMYYHWGRRDESFALYEEVGRMSVNSSDTMIRQAKMFYNSRQPDRAEDLLHKVLRQDPDNVDALVILGKINCNQDNYDKGIGFLSRVISNCERTGTPVSVLVLFERGNCHRDDTNMEAALQDYLAVLKLNPLDVNAQISAGTIYHSWAFEGKSSVDNIEQAKHHYQEALRLDPTQDIAKENLVKVNRILGQRSKGVG